MRLRRTRPTVQVEPGEKVLAWAAADDGRPVAGTRDALYLPARFAWEHIAAADWDAETRTLRVTDLDAAGRPYAVTLGEGADRLLQLVRERVTASIVLQRHVPVRGGRGLRLVARRAPGKPAAPVTWHQEHDDGIDPTDPEVQRLADAALEAARGDLGLP